MRPLIKHLCPLLFFLTACSEKGEDEIRILPLGFRGPVIIIFDEQDGLPCEYDKSGKRVYRVPVNGILKTKCKKNPTHFVENVYEDSSGTRIKVPYLDNNKGSFKDSIYVLWEASSGVHTKIENKEIIYKSLESHSFIVGSVDELDSLKILQQKLFQKYVLK